VELAKRIVGTEKADMIGRLLSMPDGEYRDAQIRDFVSELDVLDQSRLGGVLNSLADIDTERANAITEARTSGEAIRQRETEARERAGKEQTAKVNAFIDSKIKALTDPTKGNPMFQKREKDEAWNAAVDKRLESVKNILVGQVTPEEMFNAGANSVAYHQLLSEHQTLQKENAAMKEQLSKLTAAQPKIEGAGAAAGGGNGEPAPAQMKKGANPMEAAATWVGKFRESMNQGPG
jgi:hypothetical protein